MLSIKRNSLASHFWGLKVPNVDILKNKFSLLLLFIKDSETISYSYYECPYYYEYDDTGDVDIENIGFKTDINYIRYDYTPEVSTLIHPASHIHIGHNNKMRIGTTVILAPISFILFIIRHYYPEKWELTLENANALSWCRNIRRFFVSQELINDTHELFLK